MKLGVFAFLVGIAFWSNIVASGYVARWTLICCVLPLLAWDIKPRLTAGHYLGLAFLIYSAVSIAWTPVAYDGWNQLIQFVFLGLAFCYGAETKSLRTFYIGSALALTISGFFAVAQKFGYAGVDQYIPPGGLFGNKNFMGEAAALCIVAMIAERLWWYLPGLFLPLGLSTCKGAMLGFAVALMVYLWSRYRWVSISIAIAVALGALYGLGHPSMTHTLIQRADAWKDALDGLTFWGRGVGSFYSAFPEFATRMPPQLLTFPEAHNDTLQMVYELGPGALPFLGLEAYALYRARETERLVLIAFFVEGLTEFPLYMPFTSLVAALAIGHSFYRGGELQLSLGSGIPDADELHIHRKVPRNASKPASRKAHIPA